MIPVRVNQLLILSACAIFIACGSSTNERGIASATADSTASGSAYNSHDGFAPGKPSASTTTAAPVAPAAVVSTDSTAVVATAPATTAPATASVPVAAAKPAVAKPAAADGGVDIKKGEALISKSDCFACHKVDVKVLGPSYKDVAAKYPNNAATISQLVEKIKKGGSGVWGAIPMSPHPALSDDDAKAMVKYILSLK